MRRRLVIVCLVFLLLVLVAALAVHTPPVRSYALNVAIRAALSRRGLTNVRRGTSEEPVTLIEGERFASDLARELGVRPQLVYAWIKSGRLPGRQAGSPQGRWIVCADADTVAVLKSLNESRPSQSDPNHQHPTGEAANV